MNIEKIAKQLEGLQTIISVKKILGVGTQEAIYYIYKLRKKGYVKTKYGPDKKRVYYISLQNVFGGVSYTDILNNYSPIKLSSFEVYQIYGRVPSIEETLIYAVKKKEVRYIIALLALFKKIKNWALLYKLAKKQGVIREVASLYNVSKITVKKVRKMPKRFINLALPKKDDNYIYIIKGLKSLDFKKIEKKWKVYIPLNRADLTDYK